MKSRGRAGSSALNSPTFIVFLTAQVFTYGALWTQRVATDWLVLQLSGSVATVGLTAAMQFIPIIIFGPYGGLVADRYNKRLLILLCQGLSAVACAVLAALMLTGTVQIWHVYIVAFALGLIAVVDNPTRSVFVNDLVPQNQLKKAISLNASTFHVGGLIGSGVSGLVIATAGTGMAICVSIACYLIVIALVLSIRPKNLIPSLAAPVSQAGQLKELFLYVSRSPNTLVLFVMIASVSAFGLNLPLLLAGFANDVFETGASGYGLLNSMAAIGALLGAFLSTFRQRFTMRSAAFSLTLYGIAQIAASLFSHQMAFAFALIAISCTRLLFVVLAESIVQVSTERSMRGRMMAVYMVILVGGQAVGSPLIGWIADSWGPSTGLLIAGSVPVLVGTIAFFWRKRAV